MNVYQKKIFPVTRACVWLGVALCSGLTCCTSILKSHDAKSVVAPEISGQPKLTGESARILPLVSGTDAIVARMAFAQKAQHTLDLQYYIWHNDQTGKLLAGAVIKAG